MITAALIRALTDTWGYRLRSFSPPTFVSRHNGRDLLPLAVPGAPSWMHVYPEYRLTVRGEGPHRLPGVIIGLRTTNEIDVPLSELAGLVDPRGREVLVQVREPEPGEDVLSCRKNVGLVRAVRGTAATVESRGGVEEYPLTELFLAARRETFDAMLGAAAGSRSGHADEALARGIHQLLGGPGRLERTGQVAQTLAKLGEVAIADGATVRFDEEIVGQRERTVVFRRLEEPVFVFDLSGAKTDRYPETGLRRFGPYDAEGFQPKTPSIVVVTPGQFQGSVEVFVRALRDGVPGSKFEDGLVRKYRLGGCHVHFVPFAGGAVDADAYKLACLSALERYPDPNLAIVITSHDQANLTGDASPYLVSKATFMGHGVPVQEFQVENVRRRDPSYILSTVSLACYAKMTGTPFVMRVPRRPMARELILGIGSSEVRTGRFGPVKRFVGITTVFDQDGSYLISNTSREADYESYPAALHDALRACLTEVRQRNSWQSTDHLRLVFHVFKKLKDREAIAVRNFVRAIGGEWERIEFAFVHVVDDHDWLLLDTAVPGERGKGRFVPPRGRMVRVGTREALISVTSSRELKTSTQAAPRPLMISLHRESTFDDLDYLANQIYRFTAVSWRRAFPAARPVTIMYSDWIASLLGQLREVTNWNSDVLATKLRWSRWFL